MNTIRLLLLWLAGFSTAFSQDVVLVGAAISRTGAQAELGTDYARGLELWRDEVNAAGGLLGRRVELRLLDDGSRAVRARELYAELIGVDKADLLIGPYGSAATLIAAAEAERARRVMINGAGPASAVHSRAPRYLFQSTIPYASYGADALQVAAETGYRRLFILARDDAASRDMAEGTHSAAQKDFVVGAVEIYRGGLTDFAPQVAKARAARAETWIAFGDVRDAAEMVKTFKRLDYAPAFFFARGVAHPRFIYFLGQDAEFAVGAAEFDTRVSEAARAFAKAFSAKWSVPPTLAAAEGHAAGTVLAAAVRSAGTLDQEKLRGALAALEVPTVLGAGAYKVAPENGRQIGIRPALVQIRKGYPELGMPLLPYPQWNERALIR